MEVKGLVTARNIENIFNGGINSYNMCKNNLLLKFIVIRLTSKLLVTYKKDLNICLLKS